MNIKKAIILFSTAALILLTQCNSYEEASPKEVNTVTPIPPTHTVTRLPIATMSPTSPPTHTPTWTALPTLLSEDAQIKITKLIETNGDCELPCVLGIIPGETPADAVVQEFQSFASHYKVRRIREGTEHLFEFDNYESLGFWMIVSNNVIEKLYSGLNFSLKEVITTLGIPDQVLLDLSGIHPKFEMIFFYQESGFMAAYHGYNDFPVTSLNDSEFFEVCLDELDQNDSSFSTWSLNSSYLITDILSQDIYGYDSVEDFPFLKLEEVSESSTPDIYSAIMNDENYCIQTHYLNWP